MENEEVSVWRATQIFRNFLHKYRDRLTASVIVAGYDDDEGGQVRFYCSGTIIYSFFPYYLF